MPRYRTIKPEICVSEQVMRCSREARLTFILMWGHCDDAGRHAASPLRLKASCFPGDSDIDENDLADWVAELIEQKLLIEYEVEGERIWAVTGWHRHQRIDKPKVVYPAPPNGSSSSEQPPPNCVKKSRGVVEESATSRLPVVEESATSRRGVVEESPTGSRLGCVRGEERRGEERRREGGRSNGEQALALAPSNDAPSGGIQEGGRASEGAASEEFVFLLKGGSTYTLGGAEFESLARDFSSLDLGQQMRIAARWCADNPRKRKTERGMPAFLSNWCKRAIKDQAESGAAEESPQEVVDRIAAAIGGGS